MNTFVRTALLAIIVAVTATTALHLGDTPAGGFIRVNSNILKFINPVVNSAVNSIMSNLKIKKEIKINKDGFDIHLFSLYMEKWECNNCVDLSTQNGYVQLQVDVSKAVFHIHFDAHYSIFGTAGECNVEFEDLKATAQLKLGGMNNGKPTVNLNEFKLSLNKFKPNCNGLVGNLIDTLNNIIGGQLIQELEKEAAPAVTKAVDNGVNNYLQKLNLQFPITNNFATLDFNLISSSSSITSSGIQIASAAKVYETSNPGMSFPFSAPGNLNDACSSDTLSIGLSTYSFETALYTYYKGGHLEFEAPNALTAGDIALAIPGFAKKLGASAKLNITVAPNATGSISIANGAFTANVPLHLTISGAQGTTFVLGAGAIVAIDLGAKGGSDPEITFSVSKIALSNPSLVSTNVGGGIVLPTLIKILDGVVKSVLIPIVNSLLAPGFPLPSYEGYSLSNPQIKLESGLICIGASVSHN